MNTSLFSCLLAVSVVAFATAAYAVSLGPPAVQTLNPSPYSYIFTTANSIFNVQSASLTLTSGSITSVTVVAWCGSGGSPQTMTATVTALDSAGSSLGSGSSSFARCKNAVHTYTITLSPVPSTSSVAKIEVDMS